ncbi:hypothetical protein DFP73DRAFT_564144 [Morchella snyderi]|nr:hypothetical protein DFP73DRAFT_564144 [Morchella snyderi]
MPPAPAHAHAPAIDHTTLSDLPAPMLSKILDDLPISSIVSFAATKTPHITSCILAHHALSLYFRTPAALETVVAYHQLLTAISAVAGHGTSFADRIIDSHYSTPMHIRTTPGQYYIHNPLPSLHARAVAEINALAPNDMHYFAQFVPPASNVWDSSSLALLQARLDEVVRNSARMQAEKLLQLHRLHAIREANAARLKAKMDPSQEPRPRRPPLLERLAGQVRMLEAAAVPRERVWTGPRQRTVKVWRYLGRWVPVPYDRYLGMVLKVLGRWPLADEAMPGVVVPGVEVDVEGRRRPKGVRAARAVRAVEVVEEWFDEGETYSVVPAAAAGKGDDIGSKKEEEEIKAATTIRKIKYLPSPKRPPTHTYPASTIKHIRTALIGLKYTYAVPGISPRARTMYTPYSAPEHQSMQRSMQPCFAMPEGGNEPLAYALNDKELDWLEAFLACCDYMSRMQETWAEGVTVQQWWESREFGHR